MADKNISEKNNGYHGESIVFKFHGRQEALNIINSGGDIVSYLSDRSDDCPLIGSEIELVKKLGKGVAGAAFLVKIQGMGPKEYVAKAIKIYSTIDYFTLDKPRTLRDIATALGRQSLTSVESIIAVNGGMPDEIIEPDAYGGVYIYVPIYSKLCRIKEDVEYMKTDGSQTKVIFPTGSYLCDENQYSEYINGLLCGNLYRDGISINFIDVFDFITCPLSDGIGELGKSGRQYIFMEKIDSSYDKWSKCIEDIHTDEISLIEVFYIQIIHAIATYQKIYQLQHNDLHPGNIFIEKIKPNSQFNGQNIHDCDYFHYHIDDTDLYLPYIPILAKIGDFGLSVKYSKPIVGDEVSVSTGYDQQDGDGPWIPNWYTESYDILTVTNRIHLESSNKFITNVLMWMLNVNGKKFVREAYFVRKTGRPFVHILDSLKNASPKKVLTNKQLMSKYTVKPSEGKIVTLGFI